jgi:hypothetical protein
MSDVFIDGDLNSPVAIGLPSISYPFDNNSARRISQKYACLQSKHEKMSIGETHPTFSNAILTEETASSDIGGGVVEFSRVFHEVPSTITEFATMNVTYPAIYQGKKWKTTVTEADDGDGDSSDGDAGGDEVVEYSETSEEQTWLKKRESYTKSVIAKVQKVFYSSGAVHPSTGEEVSDASDYATQEAWSPKIYIDWYGYVNVDYVDELTNPTWGAYLGMVYGRGKVVLADSKVEKWRGNIYMVTVVTGRLF